MKSHYSLIFKINKSHLPFFHETFAFKTSFRELNGGGEKYRSSYPKKISIDEQKYATNRKKKRLQQDNKSKKYSFYYRIKQKITESKIF